MARRVIVIGGRAFDPGTGIAIGYRPGEEAVPTVGITGEKWQPLTPAEAKAAQEEQRRIAVEVAPKRLEVPISETISEKSWREFEETEERKEERERRIVAEVRAERGLEFARYETPGFITGLKQRWRATPVKPFITKGVTRSVLESVSQPFATWQFEMGVKERAVKYRREEETMEDMGKRITTITYAPTKEKLFKIPVSEQLAYYGGAAAMTFLDMYLLGRVSSVGYGVAGFKYPAAFAKIAKITAPLKPLKPVAIAGVAGLAIYKGYKEPKRIPQIIAGFAGFGVGWKGGMIDVKKLTTPKAYLATTEASAIETMRLTEPAYIKKAGIDIQYPAGTRFYDIAAKTKIVAKTPVGLKEYFTRTYGAFEVIPKDKVSIGIGEYATSIVGGKPVSYPIKKIDIIKSVKDFTYSLGKGETLARKKFITRQVTKSFAGIGEVGEIRFSLADITRKKAPPIFEAGVQFITKLTGISDVDVGVGVKAVLKTTKVSKTLGEHLAKVGVKAVELATPKITPVAKIAPLPFVSAGVPKAITYQKIETIQTQVSKQLQKQISKQTQIQIQRQVSRQISTQVVTQAQISKQLQKQMAIPVTTQVSISKQLSKQLAISIPTTTTMFPTPVTTITPPPALIPFGIPSFRRGVLGVRRLPVKAKYKYVPSYGAIVFKIFGRRPTKKVFTGLELRRIPKKFRWWK